MQPSKIKIGSYYRHKATPNYAYAKALEVIKPKTGMNNNSFTIVKCEWVVDKGNTFGMIKYFDVRDLIVD